MVEALGTIARLRHQGRFMDQIEAAAKDRDSATFIGPVSASASIRPSWWRIASTSPRAGPAPTRPRSGRRTAKGNVSRSRRFPPPRRRARGTPRGAPPDGERHRLYGALHARAAREGAIRATSRCRSRSSRSRAPKPAEIADGAALWTKPKSEISAADYTDFYRSLAGAVRRSGADDPFPGRGPAGIHRPGLRAGLAAVRPVRSGPQGVASSSM